MHQPTRRSLLLLGGAAGVSALAALAAPAQASASAAVQQTARHPGSAIAARSSFAAAVGGTVTATADNGRFRLKLLEIADLGQAKRFEPEQNFNLIFRVCRGPELPEGIYRLGSARFPVTTLLLTAVGPSNLNQFQALVNRSVPS